MSIGCGYCAEFYNWQKCTKMDGRLHRLCEKKGEWVNSRSKICGEFRIDRKRQMIYCHKYTQWTAIGTCDAKGRKNAWDKRDECKKCKQAKDIDAAFRLNFLRNKKKSKENISVKEKKIPQIKLKKKE